MGPEGAVNIVYRNARSSRRPTRRRGPRELHRRVQEKFANPYKAAELGFVDEVIHRAAARPRADFRTRHPARKHGNIPL
jgi:propionyl-CoA carboxylase beta chain